MSVSGILDIYDQFTEFAALHEALAGETAVSPLRLPAGARPSVLAKLYLQRQTPIILLTGRVESAAACVAMCQPSAVRAMLPNIMPPAISTIIMAVVRTTTSHTRRSL